MDILNQNNCGVVKLKDGKEYKVVYIKTTIEDALTKFLGSLPPSGLTLGKVEKWKTGEAENQAIKYSNEKGCYKENTSGNWVFLKRVKPDDSIEFKKPATKTTIKNSLKNSSILRMATSSLRHNAD